MTKYSRDTGIFPGRECALRSRMSCISADMLGFPVPLALNHETPNGNSQRGLRDSKSAAAGFASPNQTAVGCLGHSLASTFSPLGDCDDDTLCMHLILSGQERAVHLRGRVQMAACPSATVELDTPLGNFGGPSVSPAGRSKYFMPSQFFGGEPVAKSPYWNAEAVTDLPDAKRLGCAP